MIVLPLTESLIGAIEAAGFRRFVDAARDRVEIPLEEETVFALVAAGFIPPAEDGRRQQLVAIAGQPFLQAEMRDADLQEWLLLQRAAGELLDDARQAGDEERLFAIAQFANVDLVARALGITQEEAQALPLSARRHVVARQDLLNGVELYAALLEVQHGQ